MYDAAVQYSERHGTVSLGVAFSVFVLFNRGDTMIFLFSRTAPRIVIPGHGAIRRLTREFSLLRIGQMVASTEAHVSAILRWETLEPMQVPALERATARYGKHNMPASTFTDSRHAIREPVAPVPYAATMGQAGHQKYCLTPAAAGSAKSMFSKGGRRNRDHFGENVRRNRLSLHQFDYVMLLRE